MSKLLAAIAAVVLFSGFASACDYNQAQAVMQYQYQASQAQYSGYAAQKVQFVVAAPVYNQSQVVVVKQKQVYVPAVVTQKQVIQKQVVVEKKVVQKVVNVKGY